MFSGGICSYIAAKRWKQTDPDATLLFSDTGIEDEDLYRFLHEATDFLQMRLVKVSRGESFDDMCKRHNAIPNNRMPFCSQQLKVEPAVNWLRENPSTDIVIGLDWTETHRVERVEKQWNGYKVHFPAMERPLLMKPEMMAEVEADGIEVPRLYKLGLAHNNCGGGCVRGGHGAWKKLFEVFPERFEEWAQREETYGRGYTFCKDRRGGKSKPITLRQLVKQECDPHDIGGCGCFLDDVQFGKEDAT